jgi:cytochrome c oxidase subunit II
MKAKRQRLQTAANRRRALCCCGLLAIPAVLLSPSAARADAWSTLTSNMSYMVAAGTKNYGVVRLLYFVLAVSVVVVLLIAIFVVIGMFRRRAAATEPRLVPVERRGNGLPWIYIGSALSLVVLFAIAIWDYVVLANVAVVPPNAAPFTIEVVGHQWWWELRYKTDDPTRTFDTANEVHIPVGKPVRLLLNAADVIHSFWVPVLTGKMDTIPGQNNQTWIEAQTAGVYRGQCTEYCGLEHAKMGLLAIAEPQQQFDDWWNNQLEGAKTPESQTAQQAESDFVGHCGICHTVRGTRAGGRVGPDLSHLMTRLTIASGTLPNTPGYLSGWIAEPQHLKPGNYMPDLDLSGPQLTSIRSFLETLH